MLNSQTRLTPWYRYCT